MKKTITLLALSLLTATFTFAQTVIWQNSVTPVASAASSVTTSGPSGQQFIVASPNTSIQEIKLYVCKIMATSDYTVSIYNDNGANQIGTKVGDIYNGNSSNLNIFALNELTINSANCLNNAMPQTLVAGQKYWVAINVAIDNGIFWIMDNTTASINGTGASTNKFSSPYYSTNLPFFMKITAGVPVATSLDKTSSDEVSVNAIAKSISINSVFEHYSVELISVSGVKVLTQSVCQGGNTTIDTDVTSGIYFVKVSAAGRCFTKKVFLQ